MAEGILADNTWENTTSIISGELIETGAIILSIIMLKTLVFNKAAGWIGVLTHGFDLLSLIIGLFYLPMKQIFTAVAGPLHVVWFILVGVRRFQLGKNPNSNH